MTYKAHLQASFFPLKKQRKKKKKRQFGNKLSCNLRIKVTTLLNIFLLDVNFDKSTIGLYCLLKSFMLINFVKNQKSIAISSIKCLNFKFVRIKLCIKK